MDKKYIRKMVCSVAMMIPPNRKQSSNLYSYYSVHFCTVNYLYITLNYFTVI